MNAVVKPELDPGRVLTTAVFNAAANLGISNGQLAKILATSSATVSRLSSGGVLEAGKSTWDAATTFVLIYRSLASILGNNIEQMKAWLTTQNRDLGSRPLALMERPSGLHQVRVYLDAYRGLC